MLLISPDTDTVAALAVSFADCLDTASTTSEGLSMLANSVLDVVVFDLPDPLTDLVCVVRTLCALGTARHVVVIGPRESPPAGLDLSGLALGGVFKRPYDLAELLARIHSLMRLRGHALTPVLPASRLTMSALRYLTLNYSAHLNMDAMAKAIGVSSRHLAHVLKRDTGLTVTQHLTRIRVAVARYLLRHTDHKLEVIAEAVGLCDAPYLCRVFRTHTGFQPSEYRRGPADDAPLRPGRLAPAV